MKRLTAIALILCCMAFFGVEPALCENRWLDETTSTTLGPMVRDEARNRIYLADNEKQLLRIIDIETEQVIKDIPTYGTVLDLAISKNNTWLAAVINGKVCMLELNRFLGWELQLQGQMEGTARSVAFDYNQGLYVMTTNITTYSYRGWIYLVDFDGRFFGYKVIKKFGVGSKLAMQAYQGLLRTDATGTILYVAEQGLSPASLYKIDVTNRNPVFVAEDYHGALGSYLKDFVISPRYNEVYVVCGAPYGIQVIDATTMARIALLETGPYPVGVDVSRYGNEIYGVPGSAYNNFLFKFRANPADRGLIQSYPLLVGVHNGQSQPRGLLVDRFAEKAFVIHGDTYPTTKKMQVQAVDITD